MLRYKPNPSQVKSLNGKEYLKTTENNLENVREMKKMQKLERDFRVYSYTQLTMTYYCQLGKNKISLHSRWNTQNKYG